MSSAPSTTTTTTTAPASTPTDPPSQNQLTSGTNYFFGFLIAFIAFLFIFLSLGVAGRRRRIRRRRDILLYGPDDDGGATRIPQTEPVMWQPQYANAPSEQWGELMPLSSSVLMREVIDTKVPIAAPARPSRNPFVVYFGFPAMKPSRKGLRKIKVPQALQVAVMISMPKPPEDGEDGRNEYQIGLVQVPWKGDVAGT
ncbi:hypothetical protein C8J57DRAFT_1525230 [Mycena rebaudengoi]|nr:hypothetical protein C8J57DRAFT_1525230 [Mycena rebaudengoi]